LADNQDTSKFLMRGLLHAYYWCDESLQNAMRKAGLPPLSRTKSMIMVNIADGITRPSDLARNIGISRQAIQQTLVEMEKTGLITLAPDPADGRAKIVKFSRRGTGIGKIAFDALDEIEAELSRRLGAKGVAQVKDLLFRDWGPVLNTQADSGLETNGTRFARSK
jgi:DNA-binding MarR family transcriptional regulator